VLFRSDHGGRERSENDHGRGERSETITAAEHVEKTITAAENDQKTITAAAHVATSNPTGKVRIFGELFLCPAGEFSGLLAECR
jgi:hypothetical protein